MPPAMLIMPSQLDQALQHGRANDDVSHELLKSDTGDSQYSIKAQHAQRASETMDMDTDADADVDGDADSVALASVITQVTAAPEPSRAHAENGSSNGVNGWAVQQSHGADAAPKGGWRTRFKSLLCCFAPPNNYYHYRSSGNEYGPNSAGSASAHYALPQLQLAAPPQPPRVYREAVIGPRHPDDLHKKTLVLDLDETLVHSSFKPIPNPDYIIPVEIDGRLVDVYVLKRPWLDHFLSTVGPRFEVVVFTASLAKYADPLLDLMDKTGAVRWRLFRESCCPYEGNYVKDLLCLGRDLQSTIIVDNSPHSYVFQPQNALPIGTFIDNMEDQELLEIMPALLKIENVDDVRRYLGSTFPNGTTRRHEGPRS